MEELKANIVRMSSPGSAESQVASQWIAAFQESEAAWSGSCQLLVEADTFKFYGLTILYNKLKKSFFEIEDKGLVDNLKKCLFEHITNIAQTSPINMVIGRYMALCLSNIFIQVGSEDSIRTLFSFLHSILQYSPLLVLEFIKILPEEVDNRSLKITRERRYKFKQQMGDNLHFVLQFLNILWPSSDAEVKVAILKSTKNWSRYSDSIETFFSSEIIVNSLSNIMISHETFSPSLDIWIEIMEKMKHQQEDSDEDRDDDRDDDRDERDYESNNDDNDSKDDDVEDDIEIREQKIYGIIRPCLPIIQKVWTDCITYLGSNGLLNNLDDDDIDVHPFIDICRKIAEFFNVYSTLFIDNILSKEDFDQELIISQLIQCYKCPLPTIGALVTEFFDLAMRRIRWLRESNVEVYNQKGEYLASVMMPAFSEILMSSIEKSVIPADKFALNNADVLEYNYDGRRVFAYAAKDAIVFIGETDSRAIINRIIQAEISSGDVKINRIEAILRIARHLCKEKAQKPENGSGGTSDASFLINFIYSIPRDNVIITDSIISVIDAFVPWLKMNPSFIPQAMQILIQSLDVRMLERVASTAFDELCYRCNVSSYAKDILQVYSRKRDSGFFYEISEQNIVKGVMSSLEYLEDSDSSVGLNLVLGMIVARIQSCGNDDNIINREFSVLKVIAASSKESVFTTVFPSLLALSQSIIASKTSSSACEDIITFLKNAVRKCKSNISTLSPIMGQFIVSAFTQYKYPSILYLGSVLVRLAPNNRDVASMAYELFSVFIRSTTISPTLNLDELEEFLYLIKVSLENILQFFVSFNNFSVIINIVISCLKLPFRGNVQGKLYDVVDSLYRLSRSESRAIQRAQRNQTGAETDRLTAEAAVFAQMRGGLIEIGSQVVESCLQSMSRNPFCYALFYQDSRNSGNLCEMLWSVKIAFPDHFPQWLLEGIAKLEPTAKALAAKLPLMSLADISEENKEKDSWIILIREFTNEVDKRVKSSI